MDWWALGIISYLLYTRKFPVFLNVNKPQEENGTGAVENGHTAAESSKITTTIITSNLPVHLETIPAAAQDLMKRLFERNPRHRLKSVRELERIAMFYKFSFDDCRARKMNPRKYI